MEKNSQELVKIKNDYISCTIMTRGATLCSLEVKDREGNPRDIILGYDSIEEYIKNDGYLGAIVGRYANRIAKGHFSLNGKDYNLAINNGPNHLHGGINGFSERIWNIDKKTDNKVTFSLYSADGEEGYPGNMTVEVTYELIDSTLSIKYRAKSDADTVCNLTNHSYFNLSGHSSGPVLDQIVSINADKYTPTDDTSIPFGTIENVDGTPMDLRKPTKIGAHIHDDFLQLNQASGYDHNYVLNDRHAACAKSLESGIQMDVYTTMPGMQFYTANFIEKGRIGKNGSVYGPHHGFCFETQFFPDSPNKPNFPSCILKANEKFEHETSFKFSNF